MSDVPSIDPHRRRVLSGIGSIGVLALAGCAGETDESDAGPPIDEVKNEARFIEYDELMRNSDEYVDEYLHFPAGLINQVFGDEDEGFRFVVLVTEGEDFWKNEVVVRWDGERFLEGDFIEIWGRFFDLIRVEPLEGGERTVPDVTALDINLKEER